jgi:hypothetical protein
VEWFDATLEAVLPLAGLVSKTVCHRTEELLNYALLCPAARMEGYVVERSGKTTGYFLLAFTQGECRVAEMWIASADERDWLSALLLAVKGRDANQISIGCGTGLLQGVAKAAGFHLIARLPIYVKDPKGLLPTELDAATSMLDTDAFYL